MSRPHRTFALAIVFFGLALAGVAATPQQGPGEPPVDVFFGYEPGEERLYRIGPPDSLAPGEEAEWRIRFAGTREHATGTLAVFEFEHQRFELVAGTWNPAEELMEVRVRGSAGLGRDGFPVQVEYEQRFFLKGESTASDGRRFVRFEYDPERERYTKFLQVARRDWEFDFAIPGSDEIDRERLRGLFLFLPSALGCLGTSRGTCVETEPALANPGFLTFVLPYLLEEERSERHFHFFMPEAIGGSPFAPVNPARWMSRERNNITSQERYFERWKMKLGASEDVEVGPRTMHAWELDLGGGIDKIWIEPSGRVLRVDLEETFTNRDRRHIRLVFPFEEFTSPNADPAETCCG